SDGQERRYTARLTLRPGKGDTNKVFIDGPWPWWATLTVTTLNARVATTRRVARIDTGDPPVLSPGAIHALPINAARLTELTVRRRVLFMSKEGASAELEVRLDRPVARGRSYGVQLRSSDRRVTLAQKGKPAASLTLTFREGTDRQLCTVRVPGMLTGR